jgi:S1/P1 Nuclease
MKRLIIIVLSAFLFFCLPLSAWAWNGAGHMSIGAIAYQELKREDPTAINRVVEILEANPEFENLWQSKLSQVEESERLELLFMLAARWSDDIRRDNRYDRPKWHYINFPYKPETEPDLVTVSQPDSENILTALAQNLDILTGSAELEKQSIALCWIFHLVGDVHQPLHTTALFTKEFLKGDRGGTRFYIKVKPENTTTISLHKFWDDAVGSSTNYQTVRNRATRLRLFPDLKRSNLPELEETEFDNWASVESFELAKQTAYLNGTLEGSTDKDDGAVLPPDYIDKAKTVAQKQAVLAGYRLADLLEQLY